jgi:hypothetical protein
MPGMQWKECNVTFFWNEAGTAIQRLEAHTLHLKQQSELESQIEMQSQDLLTHGCSSSSLRPASNSKFGFVNWPGPLGTGHLKPSAVIMSALCVSFDSRSSSATLHRTNAPDSMSLLYLHSNIESHVC